MTDTIEQAACRQRTQWEHKVIGLLLALLDSSQLRRSGTFRRSLFGPPLEYLDDDDDRT